MNKPKAKASVTHGLFAKMGTFRKRIHFHEWMIDVHSRLHKKQKGILGLQMGGHRDSGPVRCLGREKSSLSLFCLGKSLCLRVLIGFATFFGSKKF